MLSPRVQMESTVNTEAQSRPRPPGDPRTLGQVPNPDPGRQGDITIYVPSSASGGSASDIRPRRVRPMAALWAALTPPTMDP